MKFFYLFFFIVWLRPQFNDSNEWVLHYNVEYGWVTPGEATIKIKDSKIDNKNLFKISILLKTSNMLDYVYEIRDTIDVWVYKEDFSLYQFQRIINEGSYNRKSRGKEIIANQFLINSQDTISHNEKLFDSISLIFYPLYIVDRKKDLSILENGKIRKIILEEIMEKNVTVPLGTFDCFVLNPISNDENDIFKNEGSLKVWYNIDKLPVKIEQSTSFGAIVMTLNKMDTF